VPALGTTPVTMAGRRVAPSTLLVLAEGAVSSGASTDHDSRRAAIAKLFAQLGVGVSRVGVQFTIQ
jgi:hypothetical protein